MLWSIDTIAAVASLERVFTKTHRIAGAGGQTTDPRLKVELERQATEENPKMKKRSHDSWKFIALSFEVEVCLPITVQGVQKLIFLCIKCWVVRIITQNGRAIKYFFLLDLIWMLTVAILYWKVGISKSGHLSTNWWRPFTDRSNFWLSYLLTSSAWKSTRSTL